jgi:hypothetical protein
MHCWPQPTPKGQSGVFLFLFRPAGLGRRAGTPGWAPAAAAHTTQRTVHSAQHAPHLGRHHSSSAHRQHSAPHTPHSAHSAHLDGHHGGLAADVDAGVAPSEGDGVDQGVGGQVVPNLAAPACRIVCECMRERVRCLVVRGGAWQVGRQ